MPLLRVAWRFVSFVCSCPSALVRGCWWHGGAGRCPQWHGAVRGAAEEPCCSCTRSLVRRSLLRNTVQERETSLQEH